MRKLKRALPLVLVSLVLCTNLVGCLLNFLSPPSWIQGTWADSYSSFQFTSNDVIYTDTQNGDTFDERLLGYTDSSTSTTYTITSSNETDTFTKGDGTYITWVLSGGYGSSTLYRE
jgi:hypothetical protein